MRHHDRNKKFGRETNERNALMRSLARSLILHGKIMTTEAKAKAIRPIVEKLVTHAKNPTVAAQRLISARLGGDEEVTAQLIKEVAPKYKERPGGYLRIVKMGKKGSDARDTAMIEFV